MYIITGIILSLLLIASGLLLFNLLKARKNINKLNNIIHDKTNSIRKLNLEILIAEEKHRQYIATEFHDRVAQYLAMAKNKLSLLNEDSAVKNKKVHEIYEILDKSIRETRSLIRELNPPILHETGIGTATVWLVEEMCQNHGIKTKINNLISNNRAKLIDMETQTLLFQTTREILNNILKHSKADNVYVEVWAEQQFIWILIEDDGVGFYSQNIFRAENNGGGFGLQNIRYRLTQMHGRIEIDSEPGVGTRVKFGAPLRIADYSVE